MTYTENKTNQYVSRAIRGNWTWTVYYGMDYAIHEPVKLFSDFNEQRGGKNSTPLNFIRRKSKVP